MKLRTILPIREYPFKINYQHQIMSLGSCFAEHMGERLATHLFNIYSNPFGIVYHPLSMATNIQRLLSGKKYVREELIFHNERYHSLNHHSQFSNPDPEKALVQINKEFQTGSQHIEAADILFITFGTSYVYHHNASKTYVANCHKIPQQAFTKTLASAEAMADQWELVINNLLGKNPNLKLVFTVSPVRHVKDGLENNLISKANLRLAIHKLQEHFSQVHYFPAFEIMQDDLRDYRFYKSDLLHPNELAQDYIWNYFQQVFFDKHTLKNCTDISELIKSAEHRPFHAASVSHQKFIQSRIQTLDNLAEKNPTIDFSELRNTFSDQQITPVD